MSDEHPFQPGARVAIQQSYGWNGIVYRKAFVDKVYKSGRFTLKDDAERQQWRPVLTSWTGKPRWEAGLSGYRGRLLL